jgi:diacylglycerol O-acyltransferase / wax synthase
MKQLSGLDTQFLAIESDTTYGHVSGLAVLDPSTAPGGVLTLADVTRVVDERLHLLPVLRQRLQPVPFGLDRPYWIDDPDFDLSFHVRELALPAPGSDAQLGEQVARIFSRPLDRSRPLWELYLIQGLPDGRCAFMTKIHHALVDGMSGGEIMGILYDLAPEGRSLEPGAGLAPAQDAPGAIEMLGRGLVALPLTPLRLLRAAPSTLPHVDVASSVLGLPGAERTSRLLSRVRSAVPGTGDGEVVERPKLRAPRVPFSERISARRTFAFGSVELSTVKRVKNHYGVTVNDVVVAITAAGVRDWLVAHDALPDRALLAQIPVSVRTDEESGTFGNKISVMIVPVPTDVAEPEARVAAAHASLRAAKDRHRALPVSALQDIATFIPPAINARAARVALQLSANSALRPLYNLVISNVPGPPVLIYLAGARMEAQYPVSVITHGAGLNVTVMSYLDQMDFGVVADREQMPDADLVISGARDALAELDALVRDAAKPAVKPRAKPAAKPRRRKAS